MTLEEFSKAFCDMCGSQRCEGCYCEEWRQACAEYRRLFGDEKATE